MNRIAQGLMVAFCLCFSSMAVSQTRDPKSVTTIMGRASCAAATCHGGVVDSSASWHSSSTVWEARDPHAHAGKRLEEPLAQRMIAALVPAAETNPTLFQQTIRKRCIACHAPESTTAQPGDDLSRQLLTGVGCESCHGAAQKWLDEHTRSDFKSQSDEAQRLGMRDTKSLVARIENCVRCHIGSRSADGQVRDVNHDLLAAGHPRMLFDPLVMQARLPVHWDVRHGSAMHTPAEQSQELIQKARQIVLESFTRLKAERRSSTEALPRPEFSEFDCHACHHALASGGGS